MKTKLLMILTALLMLAGTSANAQSYYWYAGPNMLTSSTIPGSDSNWHAISGTPTSIATGELENETKINWVLAVPSALGLTRISNGEDVTDAYDVSKVTTADGVEYVVFRQISSSRKTDRIFVQGPAIVTNYYTLTYKVDGEVYKTYQLAEGAAITPEPAPTKEGYTFSGWSDIPAYMPANDVTITGTFTKNEVKTYTLTYKVDGAVYKTYELTEGTAISPEPAPTKEGYTFSGWSDIPATMPANDVTVTGSFTVNKYKLTYTVDGAEYKKYDVEYGATITPEPAPTKEGYTFSGWSGLPAKMPAYDVTVTGTFTKNEVKTYTLTYKVDGAVYKTYQLAEGTPITPEPAPTKDGYTFSGWSEIPAKMPAKDVTVTGTFTKNAEPQPTPTPTPIPDPDPQPTPDLSGYTKIAEKDWSGVKDKDLPWIEFSSPKNGSAKGGADGIEITVTKVTEIWQPQALVLDGLNLEKGANYKVIVTAKLPCDNELQINLGAWEDNTQYSFKVKATGKFQEIECIFPKYKLNVNDAHVLFQCGNFLGTTIVKKVQLYKEGSGTDIHAISKDGPDVQIFDLQGNRIDKPRKGLNIIRTKDGKAKKVLVK